MQHKVKINMTMIAIDDIARFACTKVEFFNDTPVPSGVITASK